MYFQVISRESSLVLILSKCWLSSQSPPVLLCFSFFSNPKLGVLTACADDLASLWSGFLLLGSSRATEQFWKYNQLLPRLLGEASLQNMFPTAWTSHSLLKEALPTLAGFWQTILLPFRTVARNNFADSEEIIDSAEWEIQGSPLWGIPLTPAWT